MRQLDINNNFSYGVRINIIITVMLDMLLRSSYPIHRRSSSWPQFQPIKESRTSKDSSMAA